MYFIIDARKVTYAVMLPYHIKGGDLWQEKI